jgi:5-methyltetrahydropteroyltriglutamate--homocysteine methyltransferase
MAPFVEPTWFPEFYGIAGTDCGFGTIARSHPRVHPTVAWAKLQSLVEGARRASAQLWQA